MSDLLKIGISIGDVNGIGLEVIIKTLAEAEVYQYCTPIVYGHTKVASFHRKTVGIQEFIFQVINNADQAHPGVGVGHFFSSLREGALLHYNGTRL